MIKTTGLSKASVLAALYNHSMPMDMGVLAAMMGVDGMKIGGMTEEQAAEQIASSRDLYFDYIGGRVLKVDLSNDDGFDERLYDRDNGAGAAQKAIDSISKAR